MALVTRAATAHIDTNTAMFDAQISGDTEAGEALDVCAPCYLATDGKYYMADGTAANVKAVVAGWTPRAYVLGERGVTLLAGVGLRMSYGSGLTPGAKLYLGATKGRLDTVATTGDAVGVAQVLHDGIHIRATRLI